MQFFYFLAQRRWFLRGWVVQEVILKSVKRSHDVVMVLGLFATPWRALCRFITSLSHLGSKRALKKRFQTHPTTKKYATRILEVLGRNSSLEGTARDIKDGLRGAGWVRARHGHVTETEYVHAIMSSIMNQLRGRKFTDKRDFIYGYHSLVSAFLPPGVAHPLGTPDCQLSEVEVQIRAAWSILTNMPHLELLALVEDASTKRFKELPSWVPDFTSLRPNPFLMLRQSANATPAFDASQTRPPALSSTSATTVPRPCKGYKLLHCRQATSHCSVSENIGTVLWRACCK